MSAHKIYDMTFKTIYDAYVNKVERKDRTAEELDEVLNWLTGYDDEALRALADDGVTMREFFEGNSGLNDDRFLVTGSICGVKIDEIEDPLMKEIRIMDKVVDELAKGKAIEKIKR